jgi:thiol-disulfide isomerase/thioredoxin
MNTKLLVGAVLVISLSVGAWAVQGQDGRLGSKVDAPSTAEWDTPVAAPEFTGVTDWLNSKPLKLADQKGKVVVVHFWTNGCINCIHNYVHYRAWEQKYKGDKRFLMIGVHTPEFQAEKDVERIKVRMDKNKLSFPVAVDNDSATWKAWGNRYWPCMYLVDKTGAVRHRWEGELGDDGYKKVSAKIEELLAER